MRQLAGITFGCLVLALGLDGVAAFSPDGQWVAHESDASEAFEVCVRPFPDVDAAVHPGHQM